MGRLVVPVPVGHPVFVAPRPPLLDARPDELAKPAIAENSAAVVDDHHALRDAFVHGEQVGQGGSII
jgi:hypothetical protein